MKKETPARGRPPIPADERMSERIEARVNTRQKAAWDDLGGVEWLRRKLDAHAKKTLRDTLGGKQCDREGQPYQEWINTQNPAPMIKALKLALERFDEGQA